MWSFQFQNCNQNVSLKMHTLTHLSTVSKYNIISANFDNKNPINELSCLLENLLLIQSYSITIQKAWEC